ncbi:MAG: sigma factor-like helix-turn-helix DNA-binding protein, partial [Nanoarchaeota archaeon]
SRAIADKARTIRLPVHLINKLYHLKKATTALTKELHREPTENEIAQRMGVSLTALKSFHAASAVETLNILDAPPSGDNTDNLLLNVSYNSGYLLGVDRLSSIEMKEKLATAMQILEPAEADLLQQHFGLRGQTALNLRELGEKSHVSHETIRMREGKVLLKLRKYFNQLGIEDFHNL